jgi:cell division control protein 6
VSRIFRNKTVLDIEYVPDRIIHREEQFGRIEDNLRTNLYHRLRPRNQFCLGPMGTGKTATARSAIGQFQGEATAKGLSVGTTYVNCTTARNVRGIYLSIFRTLSNGVHTGHDLGYYEKLLAEITGQLQGLVIVLDEVDKLLPGKTDDLNDFFYVYSRLIPRAACLLITNNLTLPAKFQSDLEARTKDTFYWDIVEFPSYDAVQLQDILRPRAEAAFQPGVCDRGIINKIGALGALQGFGARSVIQTALRLGETAEARNVDRLREEWIPEVLEGVIGTTLVEPIGLLDPGCKALLKWIVTKDTGVWDAEAENYFRFQVAKPLGMGETERAYVDHRGHLTQTGLVQCRRRGRFRRRGSEGWLEIDPRHRELLKEAFAKVDEA